MLNKKLLVVGTLTLGSLASVAPAAMAQGRDRDDHNRGVQWTQTARRPEVNRSFENRRYEAPRYEAPRYEAPRYEAPRYDGRRYDDRRDRDDRGNDTGKLLGAGILGAIVGAVIAR